jgi:hypothetical protein
VSLYIYTYIAGQLPYLTHLGQTISPLSSIISYLGSLNPESLDSPPGTDAFELIPSLDTSLSHRDQSRAIAFRALLDLQVGDLVVCVIHPSHTYLIFHILWMFSPTLFSPRIQTLRGLLDLHWFQCSLLLNGSTFQTGYEKCIVRAWRLRCYGPQV